LQEVDDCHAVVGTYKNALHIRWILPYPPTPPDDTLVGTS
jgi:hypothetical protein